MKAEWSKESIRIGVAAKRLLQKNLSLVKSRSASAIRIRPAVSEDADGIARVFVESAEDHARLDPERYLVPAVETVSRRYRKERLHLAQVGEHATSFVAEFSGEVVGFIDARIERSPDPMHHALHYCNVEEIAVDRRHRKTGIGEELLLAVERWGQQMGAEFASLEYHVANEHASTFYRGMGYQTAHIIAIKRL
jgi:ribosomal protein S18 acetylase RimI-like enzyme